MNPHRPCPICDSAQIHYQFTFKGHHVVGCDECQTLYLDPQPSDEVLSSIYSASYFLGGSTPSALQKRFEMKCATAQLLLNQLQAYKGNHGGNFLEIGCGQGEMLFEAEALGYQVVGVEFSADAARIAQKRLKNGQVHVGEINSVELAPDMFDVIVAADVIEHVRKPDEFMKAIRRVLKANGVLVLVTVSTDTWTARLLKNNWMEFKVEHLTYFSNNSLQSLMYLNGFRQVRMQPTYKVLNPRYVLDHFERYRVKFLTSLLKIGYQILPSGLRERSLQLTGSGVTVMARKAPLPRRRKVSIVVPVYNEAATFSKLMDELLNLTLDGLDKEIIIVESNSTDGTREHVLRYKDTPDLKVILQNKPHGKGFAVRTGFEHVTGDFIIIQDADLEYDINDYHELLEPLMLGRRSFVLGSRHKNGSKWNIREFEQTPIASVVLNVGHLLFSTLLNLLYGHNLGDPFTMYKVFWQDCIDGLAFESNRFDFDFELVIKLLRKGYIPLEIPINYHSRSFREGKKVSFIRDPLTWIVALIKFRFKPLYPSARKESQ